MADQIILNNKNNYLELREHIAELGIKRILLVGDNSLNSLGIGKFIYKLGEDTSIKVDFFSDFQPNPKFESVIRGVEKFQASNSDCIIAIGGGSSIDVAKCIKIFGKNDPKTLDVKDPFNILNCPLIAIPTTAGTGSEATRFSVVYYNGEKISFSSIDSIPSTVLLDPSVLETLPLYQKKATMLDALCHAIESFWSIHSTYESEKYATQAINLILENYVNYLEKNDSTYESMLLAANFAGKAINITQTTAGHAMSYKLTSLYNIAHGHAVGLCVNALWPILLLNDSRLCIDSRGLAHLTQSLTRLAQAMGGSSMQDGARIFDNIMQFLNLPIPKITDDEILLLSGSVNVERMSNFPVQLSRDDVGNAYRTVGSRQGKGANKK